MNIYEKLSEVQNELKAPKNQRNSFGGYNYRSCEDILEAVKPLNKKHKLTLLLSDDIEQRGDRYYVVANAILFNQEKPEEKIVVRAFARESEDKKGMDSSQLTGSTSSYARKYALNGLYEIDDNKDADTMKPDEPKKVPTPKEAKKELPDKDKITAAEMATIKGLLAPEREPKFLEYFKVSKLEELTKHDYVEALSMLQKK